MMQYWIIPIVVMIAFSIFSMCRKMEEKKAVGKDVIRTHPPLLLSAFLLVVAFASTGLEIFLIITSWEVIILLFTVMPVVSFFGYAWFRFNYVVIDGNDVVVYRLFGKKKQYRFDEIAYFKDTTHAGMSGGLICYDKKQKKMFAVEEVHVGVSLIIQRLRENKVRQITGFKSSKK